MLAFKKTALARFTTSFVTMLVLAGFVVSSLVPLGFMPEFSPEGGSYELVICSGMGTKVITVQDDNSEPHKEKTSFACEYKSFVSTQSVEPVPLAYLPAPVIELGQASFVQEQVSSQTLHSPLSARGPPTV